MDNNTQNTGNFLANLSLKVVILAAVALVLVSAGSGALASRIKLFSWGKKDKHALTIERTPVRVKDVKAVGKLVTASFYDELIFYLDKSLVAKAKPGKEELVIIQKGRARLGIDLTTLEEGDIFTKGDSIRITLPPVVCLDVSMNPSDIEVFDENGRWTLTQMVQAMKPCVDSLQAHMNKSNVLEKARTGADEVVTQFLEAFGYKRIRIEYKPAKPVILPEPTAGK
jgi:hypothetical protein